MGFDFEVKLPLLSAPASVVAWAVEADARSGYASPTADGCLQVGQLDLVRRAVGSVVNCWRQLVQVVTVVVCVWWGCQVQLPRSVVVIWLRCGCVRCVVICLVVSQCSLSVRLQKFAVLRARRRSLQSPALRHG